jgi:hypothetical protein
MLRYPEVTAASGFKQFGLHQINFCPLHSVAEDSPFATGQHFSHFSCRKTKLFCQGLNDFPNTMLLSAVNVLQQWKHQRLIIWDHWGVFSLSANGPKRAAGCLMGEKAKI